MKTIAKNFLNVIKNFWSKTIRPYFNDPFFLSCWDLDFHHSRENTNQLSTTAGPIFRKHEYINALSGEAHMVVEDFHTSIMPYMHNRQDKEQFNSDITPPSDSKKRIITNGLSQGSHNNFYLEESICDFFRDVTHSLMQYGKVYYEIVYKKDSDKNVTEFNLTRIHPYSLIRGIKNYYQFIPWWTARKTRSKVQLIKIPKEKVIVFRFPEQLGGSKGLQRMFKKVKTTTIPFMPNFVSEFMKNNELYKFNHSLYHNNKTLETAKITNALSWPSRGSLQKLSLEYYSIYRYILYQRSKVIIRDSILKTLNQAMNGKILNLGVEILINGVPNNEEVSNALDKLKKGDTSFEEVTNPFMRY